MANAWLAHVKSTMKAHKGMKFKDVLKLAKKTYKKSGTAAKKTTKKGKKGKKGKKTTGKKSKKGKKRMRGGTTPEGGDQDGGQVANE